MAGKRPSKKAKLAEPLRHRFPTGESNRNRDYEVFWGETKQKRAFEDRHASTQTYIDYMQPRCVEHSRVLKKTGGTRGRIAGLRRLSPAYVTLP